MRLPKSLLLAVILIALYYVSTSVIKACSANQYCPTGAHFYPTTEVDCLSQSSSVALGASYCVEDPKYTTTTCGGGCTLSVSANACQKVYQYGIWVDCQPYVSSYPSCCENGPSPVPSGSGGPQPTYTPSPACSGINVTADNPTPIFGQTVTITATVQGITNGGTVSALTAAASNGTTLTPGTLTSPTRTFTLTAPSTVGTFTVNADATVSNGGGSSTCTGSAITITVSAPTVNVVGNACLSPDLSSCSPCTPPNGFTGNLSFDRGATNYGSATLQNGTYSHTFTGIVADKSPYTMTLIPSGGSNWHVVNPGIGSLSLDSSKWPTNGATYDQGSDLPNNHNFCVSQDSNPWFQIAGGDGAAIAGGYSATVPASAYAASERASMSSTTPIMSSGVLLAHANVTNSSGQDVGSGVDWRVNNETIVYNPIQGLDYFARSFEISPTDNMNGVTTLTSANVATIPNVSYRAGNLDINDPSNPIAIGDNVSKVIFVTGDVNVYKDITTSTNKGFFAIIAGGNIIFHDTVHQAQGVFIANNQLTVNKDEIAVGANRQFVGEGVFVGWGGVSLQRDLTGLINGINPAEKFIYRADLLVNAPDGFKRSTITWRETNPKQTLGP